MYVCVDEYWQSVFPRMVKFVDPSQPATVLLRNGRSSMKRLCFLMPDAASAHGVVDDLRRRGIADANIYVVARAGTELGDLPDAGDITESDFYPQLERGLAAGAVVGLIGGLIAMRVAGAVFGGAAIALFGLIGAGVNGVLAAVAGAAFPNSRLAQFEQAIEAGQVLVMVDVIGADAAQVEEALKRLHPEILFEGVEPRTPLVPSSVQ